MDIGVLPSCPGIIFNYIKTGRVLRGGGLQFEQFFNLCNSSRCQESSHTKAKRSVVEAEAADAAVGAVAVVQRRHFDMIQP